MGCVQGKCCCFCCCRPSTSDENGDGGEGPGGGMMRANENQPLVESSLFFATVPSHDIRLEYAFLTQRGHYPDSPDRENQDCLCIQTQIQGNPNVHFFGVFDGHGQFGTQCSNFAKERLVEALSNDPQLLEDPVRAYTLAFQATNSSLHESEIDDSMSGTTAITVLVVGDFLYVANVGDSRAVAGVWNGSSVAAEDLSCDQTPFRKDEYERVKMCGARVLSVDQVEGVKDPSIQSWGDEEDDEGDPPRLWVQNGMYPGTAFTRSIGDLTAEKIGVTAEPEVLTVKMTPDHLFFVLASDGVFEFLSSQVIVNMVSQYDDPRDACSAIAAESYKIWLEHENRTDDITVIVVHIKDACNSGAVAASDGLAHGNSNPWFLAGDLQSVRGHASAETFLGEDSSLQTQGHQTDALAERNSSCAVPYPCLEVPRIASVNFRLNCLPCRELLAYRIYQLTIHLIRGAFLTCGDAMLLRHVTSFLSLQFLA